MSSAAPGTVEFWAQQKPDALAIIEGERSLTWSTFADKADRLAHAMRELGLLPGDVVAMRLQVRLEWSIVSLAAAKLGCSTVGINWRLTPNETRQILANSGAKALVCDDCDPAVLLPSISDMSLKVAISLDEPASGFESYTALIDKASPRPLLSAGPPRMVVYTSGTTGEARGVVRAEPTDPESRQILAEYRQSIAEARPQGVDDITLISLPLHHSTGPRTLWNVHTTGGLAVLQRRFDPAQALQLIGRYKVTLWTVVPTMLKRLAALPTEVLSRYDVSSIRLLAVGAAPVPDSLKEWCDAYFGHRLTETYGSSEASLIASLGLEMERRPGSCGKPFRHVKISIRDNDGREVAAGEQGEIWVWTPMNIQAYLNSPPLGEDTLDARGYFRTGDIGKQDFDGYLYLTDRAKDMIVSGGVNIYPAEIESAIMRHPAIQDVAVIGVPDDDFGEVAKAFCEVKPGHVAEEADVLAHSRHLLASYKRPKSIEFVEDLPRNAVGKILKRELREPYWKDRKINV